MQPAFCIFSSYLPIHQNILKLFPIHPHVHTPCQGWPRLWQSSKPSFRIATDSRSWYQLNQNVTKEMASTYLHFASILSSAWLYISITVTLSVCAARASLCRRLLLWRHSSRSHSQQQQLRPAAGLLQKAEPAFPSSAAASSSDAMQQHRQPTAHLPGNRAIPHHIDASWCPDLLETSLQQQQQQQQRVTRCLFFTFEMRSRFCFLQSRGNAV